MIKQSKGFSLVEMAVVLVILGFVISALLLPMSAQREIRAIDANRQSLQEIHDAVLGFTLLNGRLPCPATVSASQLVAGGVEDCSVTALGAEGFLPWRTLNIASIDAWGSAWRYRVDRGFADATTFGTRMLAAASASIFSDNLGLQDANGNSLLSTMAGAERPIAIIYSVGKNQVADGQNAIADNIYELSDFSPVYDDMLIWIARPALLNQLVAAGRVP